MKTRQIVFTKPCTAELLDVDSKAPEAGEVTVTLDYSAISAGTEKANFTGARNAVSAKEDDEAIFPRTVGYSSAGVISAVGAGIDHLKIGDRVAVFGGTHKKHLTIHSNNVITLPEDISTKEASMLYISVFPLAAIRKVHLEIGESALVMGLGILGLLAVQELKAAGACPIIAADPKEDRRALALSMGADYALDPTKEGFADEVLSLTQGGTDVCMEVTGLGAGLISALDCMKERGRVALLGCTRSSKFEIDYYGKVHGRGISLIGAHNNIRPAADSSAGYWTCIDDMKAVLRLLSGKRLNFESIIGQIHSPANAQSVYDRCVNDPKFPAGVLFDWSRI